MAVAVGWSALLAAGPMAAAANDVPAQESRPALRAVADARLVFGSFAEASSAHRYASQVSRQIKIPVEVQPIDYSPADYDTQPVSAARFRVVGPLETLAAVTQQNQLAQAAGLPAWRLLDANTEPLLPAPNDLLAVAATNKPLTPSVAPSVLATVPAVAAVGVTISTEPNTSEERLKARLDASRRGAPAAQFDVDLGVQNRLFTRAGSNESDQAQLSTSATLGWSREFAGGNLLAATLFGRLDSDDSHRSHVDVREFSFTHSAERWQVQAGIGQVFWGVVEFNHLIDVVNQTDLVENLDTEDKLGQPMVAFSALRDWGSLEFYMLPGFRERTLPGLAGRLTTPLPIDRSAAEYESGAEDHRVDGLVRLSTAFAGVQFDAYHFNGTRRTPRFELRTRGVGNDELFLVPAYDTVRQNAIAAQVNSGDTAFKLEALQQDGGPESYWAAVLGLEHTFVGAFGGNSDLGAVVEYHYDSRGGAAFDSFFEQDLAVGARLAANDLHDSQALLGVVWDTRTNERVVLLEASRRLNDRWSIELESRFFGGGSAIGRMDAAADLLNPDNKLGSVQRDDYLQFEFTRFF